MQDGKNFLIKQTVYKYMTIEMYQILKTSEIQAG